MAGLRMAQFAKIWTSIFNDEWFLNLSGLERGMFLQLIVLVKLRSDDGHFCMPSAQHLASELNVDRRTLGRFLTKMSVKCPPPARSTVGSVVHVDIPNYKKYQELRAIKNNIAPNIEQSRADKIRAEQTEEIISDLNEKTGKSFRTNTDSTQKAIQARLRSGDTVEDFKYVHTVKCDEWIGGDMEKHLNPGTLYRPGNFEKYRQQKMKPKEKSNRELIREVCGDDED